MQIDKKPVKNILAVRNDRFGEFLLNVPAFRALKKSFPGAKLTLVINSNLRELAACMEFVDNIIIWENKRHKFSQIIKFSRELKNSKYDLCVILNPAKEFNIISFLAGIPMRVGYARKWGFLLTHKLEDKKHLGQKHEIEYNLELAGLAGAETKDKSASLNIALRSNILSYLGPEEKLVAIHPWTSDPLKQWPPESFLELAKRLSLLPTVKAVIIGGKDELRKGAQVYHGLGDRIINMTAKTTLTELAGILKKCKLLISGDSGPVHLACAVNTPVIAIFRNDLPGKTAKRWGPWQVQSKVIEKSNLSDISVDEVFNKAKEVLG